jgi:hypothetical protein
METKANNPAKPLHEFKVNEELITSAITVSHHLPQKESQCSGNTTQRPTTPVSRTCSPHDGDDKESKPKDSINNIQDHVRFCACPTFESVHVSRQYLVGHENGGFEAL